MFASFGACPNCSVMVSATRPTMSPSIAALISCPNSMNRVSTLPPLPSHARWKGPIGMQCPSCQGANWSLPLQSPWCRCPYSHPRLPTAPILGVGISPKAALSRCQRDRASSTVVYRPTIAWTKPRPWTTFLTRRPTDTISGQRAVRQDGPEGATGLQESAALVAGQYIAPKPSP